MTKNLSTPLSLSNRICYRLTKTVLVSICLTALSLNGAFAFATDLDSQTEPKQTKSEQLTPTKELANKQVPEQNKTEQTKASEENLDESPQSEKSIENKTRVESTDSLSDQKQPDTVSKWRFLAPYHASYALYMDDDKVGKAERKLSRQDNQWKLETSAKASKFIFTMKSKEYSLFHINEGTIEPTKFLTSNKVTFKSERKVIQNFDWSKQTETGSKGKKQKEKWQRTIKKGVMDRMSHALQLRADIIGGKKSFIYPVSYKGKTKTYEYRDEGSSILKTKLGKLKVLKFSRGDMDDGVFTFWLSPEFNYLPVQIGQYENDKPDFVMKVLSLDYTKQK